MNIGVVTAEECPWWNPLGWFVACGEEETSISTEEILKNESYVDYLRLTDTIRTEDSKTGNLKSYDSSDKKLLIASSSSSKYNVA